MGKYVVGFNTSGAISKMPKTRRDWERQLVDDFLKAVNGKTYECENEESLMERLRFIAGRGVEQKFRDAPENFVVIGKDRDYGEREIPAAMYGWAQGYVDLEGALAPIMLLGDMVDNAEIEKASARIAFKRFYDSRQYTKQYEGCFVEVRRVA